MAWTAPRTWVVGELVTAAIFNTYIRDNQVYLKDNKGDKILWVPVTYGSGGLSRGLSHVTAPLSQDQYAVMEFYVPDDWTAIIEAVAVCQLDNNDATTDIDISSVYAANGQNYATHTENDNATTYNMSTDLIYELDVSGILTGIAVGDYVGLNIRNREAVNVLDVYGFMMRYS